MIQRIQTIFLILFIGSIISSFFFPVWQKIEFEDGNEKVTSIITGFILNSFYEENNETIIYDNFYESGILVLCCILATYSIFSYKNRLTQIKFGTINSFFTSLVVIKFLYDIFYNKLFLNINDKISFLFSFYLIFLAIFFNFLSNRFIRKDELLVNESKRIR